MLDKKAYFQGTEEPTPKKKKYKSDKAILVQPRFKEPFYHNYDMYELNNTNDKSLRPGAGWNSMSKYKSISEFRDAKRKYMKDKYKADDFWIEDSPSNRKERINKMKIRANMFNFIIKVGIDFPIDEQMGSGSIMGDSGSYSDSVPIGGQLDKYLPNNDFEGKSPDKLNFSVDYVPDNSEASINDLIDKYLRPAEPSLYGLPDGIDSKEDLDSPSDEQLQYGTTNSGNTIYNEI